MNSFRHKIRSDAQSLRANFSAYSPTRCDFNLHISQNIMNLQHIQCLVLRKSMWRDICTQDYVHFHETNYFVKAANLGFPYDLRKIHGFYEIKNIVT